MTADKHLPPTLIVLSSNQRRGAEIQGSQLASELRSRGRSTVDLVALAASDLATRLDVDALGASPLGLPTLQSLRRRSRNYEVVIGYGSSTLPACAAALAGTKVSFIYRNIGDPRAWVRDGWRRRRTALLYRRARGVVALWQGAAGSIHDLYGVPPSRISVIPNARSADTFSPASLEQRSMARANLGVDADTPLIACIGSLSPEKRVDLAIRSVADLDARLVVAGDGPLRSDLEALASRVAPERVRFVGQVDDVRQVIHAADVVLLTSSTEGMPGVVIEAGLCGVPTVATRVGAVEELITDRTTGAIVDADTEREVRAALIRTLPSARELGAAARSSLLRTHSWDAVVPSWAEAIRRAGRTAED